MTVDGMLEISFLVSKILKEMKTISSWWEPKVKQNRISRLNLKIFD